MLTLGYVDSVYPNVMHSPYTSYKFYVSVKVADLTNCQKCFLVFE